MALQFITSANLNRRRRACYGKDATLRLYELPDDGEPELLATLTRGFHILRATFKSLESNSTQPGTLMLGRGVVSDADLLSASRIEFDAFGYTFTFNIDDKISLQVYGSGHRLPLSQLGPAVVTTPPAIELMIYFTGDGIGFMDGEEMAYAG